MVCGRRGSLGPINLDTVKGIVLRPYIRYHTSNDGPCRRWFSFGDPDSFQVLSVCFHSTAGCNLLSLSFSTARCHRCILVSESKNSLFWHSKYFINFGVVTDIHISRHPRHLSSFRIQIYCPCAALAVIGQV